MNRNYLLAVVMGAIAFSPALLQAQALEEIIVTAQRRTQSLQDVPISIQAISGDELARQGFTNLDAMSDFTPTVQVDDTSAIGVTISIRGFGTTGNTVTLESAVPIFVDNLHYSRQSMLKTAFLDVESVEVLKGPQPVYFGQNATAGAFNIRSKRPTPEWEGSISANFDERKSQGVTAAAGGPINDAWGIRAAITYDQAGGFIKHIVTGEGIGDSENLGGRLTLQWQPNDRLTMLAKVDMADLSRDSEAHTICWGGGSTFDDNDPTEEAISSEGVWVNPPFGIGWDTPLITDLEADPRPDGCNKTKYGITAGAPFYAPPLASRSRDSDLGHPDVRLAAAGFMNDPSVPGWYERDKVAAPGIEPFEDLNTNTYQLTAEYEFANGISADWNAGYVRYVRNYARDNQNGVFLNNYQGREEDYHQHSTELRFRSASGGMFEWEFGAFWQQGDFDVFSSSLGAHVRRGQRFNKVWEDQEWRSLFGVLTFNFMDNKASIDVGFRYSDLSKTTFAEGYGAQWIFDVFPCAPDADPAAEDWEIDVVDPATYDVTVCAPHPLAVPVTMADNPRIYDVNADLTNLWTIPYNSSRSQGGRRTPPSWRGSRAHAVGLTAPCFPCRAFPLDGGPVLGEFGSDRIDPQVVFRYRPTDDMSVYARYAEAYKAGGFDTGQTSLPTDLAGYVFGPEYSTAYEAGVKGTFMDGRGRYDLNLFQITFKDLQLSVSTADPDDPFANLNAGQQRVKGLEFGFQYAFSDQLTGGLNGALMDGKMNVFPNAPCTETELENFATSGCDPDTELIDRSGQNAPNTPNYKVVADLDYWMPMPAFPNHKLGFNTKAYISDGYCDDIGDCGTTRWAKHWDANVGMSIGDMAEKWDVSFFVKNLNHPTQTRYVEEIENPDFGISTPSLRPSNFINYGLRLKYNFF